MICGILWAMTEKWPASLWQVCICGRPSPWRQDPLFQITQPAELESCVPFSAKAVGHRQKTGISGVPGSHIVISSLRTVTVHCLWAAWRCGPCVSGGSVSVNTVALHPSGIDGFYWEQGCCTHLWTGAELKTNDAAETRHRQSHRQ